MPGPSIQQRAKLLWFRFKFVIYFALELKLVLRLSYIYIILDRISNTNILSVWVATECFCWEQFRQQNVGVRIFSALNQDDSIWSFWIGLMLAIYWAYITAPTHSMRSARVLIGSQVRCHTLLLPHELAPKKAIHLDIYRRVLTFSGRPGWSLPVSKLTAS